ncbi:hypothetical protein Tco_1110967 [Tanacetum coccineum]|uniref:Uncharacterized protein n=1 Tax=Tanacetum coccineum TaxID=301880 RepID=A0ABQ5IMV5_9ASTR
MSKEVRTPRYLSLVVLLQKVDDEVVHKELGDRMERAATTTSSLEAEHESEKLEGSEGFYEIIDFLTASHIKNALTECPTLYASPIKQFWQTSALSANEDGVRGITVTIDRKVKVFVSEAFIRRHLKLEDSEGLKTLPTVEIFKQLELLTK